MSIEYKMFAKNVGWREDSGYKIDYSKALSWFNDTFSNGVCDDMETLLRKCIETNDHTIINYCFQYAEFNNHPYWDKLVFDSSSDRLRNKDGNTVIRGAIYHYGDVVIKDSKTVILNNLHVIGGTLSVDDEIIVNTSKDGYLMDFNIQAKKITLNNEAMLSGNIHADSLILNDCVTIHNKGQIHEPLDICVKELIVNDDSTIMDKNISADSIYINERGYVCGVHSVMSCNQLNYSYDSTIYINLRTNFVRKEKPYDTFVEEKHDRKVLLRFRKDLFLR
jgi:cytoskeletal protein CcmA (bactofilin family)